MELMTVINNRRSIRKYKDETIPDGVLNTILEGARWAPSWANTQCWELVIIKDPDLKESLQQILPPSNPAFSAMTAAPVILAVCGKKERAGFYHGNPTTTFGDWMMFDLGIVTQNICLAAHDAGLGTVIVGLFDHGKAGEIIKLPEGYEIVSLIPVGYPEKIPPPPKRRTIEEFTHADTF